MTDWLSSTGRSWFPAGKVCGVMPNRSVPARDKSGAGWGGYFAGKVRTSPVHQAGSHPAATTLSSIPTGLIFSVGSGFQGTLVLQTLVLHVPSPPALRRSIGSLPLLSRWICPINPAGILLPPACPGVFCTPQVARVSLLVNPIKSLL